MDNEDIYYKALLNKDSSFEGTFIVGVKTTGIFCRPTCTARKPKRENVEFFSSTKEAILKGYRACKVCNPMDKLAKTPSYINKVLTLLAQDTSLKLKDSDLKSMGIEPSNIRRWFQQNHGITFHAYQRMNRINKAFQNYKDGETTVTDIAFNSGYESLSGFSDSFKKTIGTSLSKSKELNVINLTRLETKLGTMIACATEKGICLLEFTDRKMLETELKQISNFFKAPIIQAYNKHFDQLSLQLEAYFEGHLNKFDLPLHMIGTDFQKKVWDILLKIPYGVTTTYAKQAEILNNRPAVRAVANANGMNKISIIIPCHRVIGSDGSLTGYGGGLWRKKQLLDLELEYKDSFDLVNL